MKKVYVDDTGHVSIICPDCGFEQNIDTTNFKGTQKKLTTRCTCGEVHEFILEFRKQYRKSVRLAGEFVVQGKGEKGEIIIRELSMKGIRFESLKSHKISIDDTLDVTFKLDNPMRSNIRRIFKAIWIRNRMVGANCIEPKLYEKDLGFYLQITE
jgi:hypothetical protein